MPTRPPSTPLLIDTIPLATIPLAIIRQAYQCSAAQARQLRARTRQDHADPAWVQRTLAGLPPSARAVLAVLVTTTGVLEFEALCARVEQQHGFTRTHTELTLGILAEQLLVMEAAPEGREPRRAHMLALTSPAAGLIAIHLGPVQHAADVRVDHVGDLDDVEHAFAMSARLQAWADGHGIPITFGERTRLAAGIGLVAEPVRTAVLAAASLDELDARLRRTLALPPANTRSHLRLVN